MTQILKILLIVLLWGAFSFILNGQDNSVPLNRATLQENGIKRISENPSNAFAVLEKWVAYYQLNKQLDLEDLSKVYQAKALITIDRTEEANIILQKLLNNSDPFVKAMVQKILAEIDFKNGRFFSSTVKIRTAIDIAKANHEEELLAELQEDLAQVFDKISKPDKAIQFYTRSLQLFTKLDKKQAIQKNSLALGRIYLSLDKLDSALFFIRQSLELAQLEKTLYAIYESKIELANYYFIKKDYDKLNLMIQEMESSKDRPKDDFFNVRLSVLKGNYAMAVISESEALIEFNKAETFSHQGFTPFIDQYIKSNLAEAYYRNGNISKAYELVKYLNHNNSSYASKENQKLADGIAKNSELNIRDREIDYLKIQNQFKEERLRREVLLREGLRRESAMKDYTLNQEQLLNAASIREKALQSQQLEKEKDLSQSLLRENDLRKATLKDEHNFQMILWVGIILLMVLSLLIFNLFKKQQEKNAIIIKQTDELEFVNKEVHHRVKNNLQVISSLLDLQSKFEQDKRYESLLKESKHRVQSMAFIHQNLYESAGMNMVDMPNYVQNLVDHLWTAYQKENEEVSICVDVEPIQLHMDMVVSIGMIINELVTNSLKYAFRGREKGKININLRETGGDYILEILDDGIGIPEHVDHSSNNSFGFKMINAFIQKLKAKLYVSNLNGTGFEIRFTKKRTHGAQ